jgi:HlyD family secretion protein
MPGERKTGKGVWLLLLLVAVVAGAAVFLYSRGSNESAPPVASPSASSPSTPVTAVGARGWIEPEDGVLRVAAPSLSADAPLVATLLVKEGDAVKSGQVLAILEGRSLLEQSVRESEAQIEVARRKLAQIKAGPKVADVDAQKMEVARWESELAFANTELQRYQRLLDAGTAPPADLDQKRLAIERARRTLDAHKERLKSIQEIRKEDIDLVTAELDAAMVKADYNRGQVERTVVRAPASGKVLKVHTHPGEQVGANGILELGKTNRMFVIAEVYETDIARVRLGQKATISGDLLPEKLEGVVTLIGSDIARSELLPANPASFADTRVVRVTILVSDGERVAGLIHGKVDVVLHQ